MCLSLPYYWYCIVIWRCCVTFKMLPKYFKIVHVSVLEFVRVLRQYLLGLHPVKKISVAIRVNTVTSKSFVAFKMIKTYTHSHPSYADMMFLVQICLSISQLCHFRITKQLLFFFFIRWIKRHRIVTKILKMETIPKIFPKYCIDLLSKKKIYKTRQCLYSILYTQKCTWKTFF